MTPNRPSGPAHRVRRVDRRTLAALALGSGLAACTAEPTIVVQHGDAVDHGRALFRDASIAGTSYNSYACSTCHAGDEPEGGASLPGGSLAGVTKRPSYWGGHELDLLRAVDACAYYFMLRDEPWSASDPDARALYAYLDAISPEGGRGSEAAAFTVVTTIVDLPAGDPTRGSDVFARACASCHGAVHTGAGRLVARAPALPDDTVDEHPAPEYDAEARRLVFVEKIRHGAFLGYGGQMPPLSREILPDEALGDLLAFLDLY